MSSRRNSRRVATAVTTTANPSFDPGDAKVHVRHRLPIHPTVSETTCLGAAYAVGLWPDVAQQRANWRADRRWAPAMSADERVPGYAMWRKAVDRSLGWLD